VGCCEGDWVLADNAHRGRIFLYVLGCCAGSVVTRLRCGVHMFCDWGDCEFLCCSQSMVRKVVLGWGWDSGWVHCCGGQGCGGWLFA